MIVSNLVEAIVSVKRTFLASDEFQTDTRIVFSKENDGSKVLSIAEGEFC